MPKNNEEKKATNDIKKLNNLFNQTNDKLSDNIYGSDNSLKHNIDSLNQDIEKIIGIELAGTKSITSDDMSTFLVKFFNENNASEDKKTLSDIFEGDTAGIFQFFQERYQNQNLLYEDLRMIYNQLFELDEAINTTRDAIVTSDDISHTISRVLKFNHMDAETNTEYSSYIRSIEEMEKKLNLLIKLKNQVIPKTLVYGNYYAYVCPYSKLFQEEYDKKVKKQMNTVSVSESIDDSFLKTVKEEYNTIINEGNTSSTKFAMSSASEKILEKTIKGYTKDISIINDCVSIPLLEGVEISELIDNDKFSKTVNDAIKNTEKAADATFDINGSKKVKKESFADQTGCYIKYIDPRRMIPIKILDTVIGYYYIHGTDFQINKSPFSSTIRVTNVNGEMQRNTEDIEMMFISKITDKIVKAFDKPFLEKNTKFKDLILNALMYNDLYTKELKFQFIPAEYVVEFKVNEDEDGNGQSVLMKALFYAKLYLALLIFKMISIITRSNDTRIYYVKNSGIDQNITNKIQEVARSIKGRQITFMDLLNYNSIISKIGAYKEIFIPVGRSGERGIEFDTLAGQDVPLNTDLMEMLRTNMLNATGVPSVIMNYVNEADYAKTLSMANSKFAGRISSLQLDLNVPITEFYKLIIKHSNITIDENILNDFEFAFNPPRTLNNINTGDMISNVEQIIAMVIKAATGENADQSDLNNQIKDKMYNTLMRQFMPQIDWTAVDDAYKNAKLELEEKAANDKAKKANKSDDSSTDEGY